MRFSFTCVVLCLSACSVMADDWDRKKLADKHAPAGIMGEHVHEKGEWMVEYRYMNMYMEDNKIGSTKVSDTAALGVPPTSPPPGPGVTVDGVLTNRGATPTQMTMEMHMAHVMYGATDDITLYTMVMLPSLTMDHLRPDLTGFTTHNSGFGDTAFGALLRLMSDCDEDLIFDLGCTVPTGEIFRQTTAPTGGAAFQPLPYPMRLGSGSFHFRPGLTYKRFFKHCSWGCQFQADLPIGRNYRDYRLGEEYRISSWTSLLLTESWALSWRGQHVWRSNIEGADGDTPNAVISTNVESFRGGYWYSAGFGTQATIKGNYLNFEVVPTMYQRVDGIQLETDYSIIGSISRAF